MKTIFFVSLVLSLLHLYKQFSTPEEIFASVQNYTDSRKMENNKFYFIYEENNYSNIDIHGEEMEKIYSLQNQTYWKNNKLLNYIFLVENITGNGKKIADDLVINMKRAYHLLSNNYFIIIMEMSKQNGICSSDYTRLSDSNKKTIIKNMGQYIYGGDYFQAFKSVINDIDYYWNKVDDNKPTDNSKNDGSSLTWLWILLGVVGVIILIIIIACSVKCCSRSRNLGYVKGIDSNYNNYNNKSINDYDYYGDNNCSKNIHIISHHSDINVNIHSDNHHDDYIHGHHIDVGRDNDIDHSHAVEASSGGYGTVESSTGDHGHAVESDWGGHGHAVESDWGGHGHAVESDWGDHGHAVESDWGGHDSGGHDGGDDGGYDGGGDCDGDCGGDGGGD